ncbi:MAG TPA: ABC transporter permease [Acidimicrobiales bacterium]|nr:ABC transporter permease [Acidimicrobiales bacterium]
MRAVGLHTIAFLAVVSLVFALPRAMPGDPLAALQDPSSASFLTDPVVRERLEAQYGLDRPVVEQYFGYLADLGRLDLGWSIERRTSVTTLVWRHLPWTLLLLGTALLASAALSFLAGVTAAWHRGKARDRALLVVMAASRSMPPYAIAALLLLAFAVIVPLFPLSGATSAFAEYDSAWARVTDVLRHLALPAAALTVVLFGWTFLLVRNTMVSVLGEDYMILARAKGLPSRILKYHHAGRNALLPFVTMLGVELGFVIGPLIFVEAVFAYPGMGSLVLRAVTARDYPVLEAAFLVLAVLALAANLLIELIYARLDPRIAP